MLNKITRIALLIKSRTLRSILGLLGLCSVCFIFEACYGSPHSAYIPQRSINLSGNLGSNVTHSNSGLAADAKKTDCNSITSKRKS